MSTLNGECYETPTNPKRAMRNAVGNQQTTALGDVLNPIPLELRDVEEVKNLYSTWPIVPFFEGGDASLAFFDMVKNLSPTHGGTIGAIGDYVLGGELNVVTKKRAGFSRRSDESDEVSTDEFHGYVDWVETFIDGEDLLALCYRLYDNYKTYGNAFLEISMTRVAGESFIKLKSHDADTCRYLATLPGEDRIVLISPLWTTDYLATHTPDSVMLYPKTATGDDSTERTIIHIKNESTGHEWYGVPDWIMCLYYAYLEIQMGEYGTKQYANDFTPKLIIETVDDPDEDDTEDFDSDDDSFDTAIDQVFTNKSGYQKKVLHRTRDVNSEKMFVHEVAGNTDEDFHTKMAELAERQIYKGHNWHPVLNQAIAGKLGMGTEFKQILRIKMNTVIRKIRKKLSTPIDTAFEMIAEFIDDAEGRDQVARFSPDFTNVFEDMLRADPTVDTDPQTEESTTEPNEPTEPETE